MNALTFRGGGGGTFHKQATASLGSGGDRVLVDA